jgi:uncharacterized protein YdeI (BOF family)
MKTYRSEMSSMASTSVSLRMMIIAAFGLILTPTVGVTAENPYLKADESWITIGGTVEGVTADSFTLDYGDGVITVEMDDGDRDADGYNLLRGDKVSVIGRIDRDFFERTSIEASSVYVENIGTTFFASSIDDEDWSAFSESETSPMRMSSTSIIGEVTDVDANEFTVNSGFSAMRVDVSSLSYDPLDGEGYQKIEVGDVVKVVGTIERDLFTGREIEADLIVELHSS